ncbi:hypothetical protein [Streptomyces sp. NPDC002343]
MSDVSDGESIVDSYVEEARRMATVRHIAGVTTPSESGADFIADAATPIAAALAAVQDQGVNVPSADVLISYTASGCIMRVADSRAGHREVVERAFWDAFTAAGWGVSYRHAGGLGLEHPSRLTSL